MHLITAVDGSVTVHFDERQYAQFASNLNNTNLSIEEDDEAEIVEKFSLKNMNSTLKRKIVSLCGIKTKNNKKRECPLS